MGATYVDRNQTERERLQRVVAGLSDDDMMRTLPNGWTIADTLAHLAFYDRRAATLLERFRREGVFASPYDYDTLNEVVPYLTRHIPPSAIAAEVVAAAEAADRAAAAVPESLLVDIRSRNEVKLERCDHRMNHLDEIEAALGPH